MVLALILLSAVLAQFVTLRMASGVVIGILAVACLFGQFWVRRLYQFIEKNFSKNLTEKERKELVSSNVARKFLPWEASLGVYDVIPDSELVGKALRTALVKEKYGVTISAVFRGSQRHFAPGGDFIIWPYDKLLCFGSEDELQKFHEFLEAEKQHQSAGSAEIVARKEDFSLHSFIVDANSPYKNKSIRDSGIRDAHKGMVVGIERGPEKILGPTGNFEMHENDLIWVVSDRKAL